jgi:hypothetical protein
MSAIANLNIRFPITYSACAEYKKKHCKPDEIISKNGITYNRSSIRVVTENEINQFIQWQLEYPEIIEIGFDCFLNVIEEQEKNETRIVTKHIKKQINDTYSKNYKKLRDSMSKVTTDLFIQDKWILFIKSQNDLCMFF